MHIRRRDFTTLLGGAAAAWPLVARAQQPLPVIGFLDAQPLEQGQGRRRAFRQSLKDNGFVEGKNVMIDSRFGGIQMERVPELLDELVRRRIAVIVVTSGPIALLAAKASTTIPIVFLVPEDPVRLGLVASLARPGGNMTGVNFFLTELAAKRLGLLREMVPGAVRVGVLVNPAHRTAHPIERTIIPIFAALAQIVEKPANRIAVVVTATAAMINRVTTRSMRVPLQQT